MALNHSNFVLSNKDQEEIRQAIAEAELRTSGEIRVHIENSHGGDLFKRALEVFKMLKMNETVLHNGVLFYVASKDRKFAVIADKGINDKVPEGFWDAISSVMSQEFKNGQFVSGLVTGITMAGEQLRHHFPVSPDDKNELSNDISFG